MTLLHSTLKAPVSNIHFLAFLDNFFQKAPTFHDPASTDRSRILTHPTLRHQGGGTEKDPTGGGLCYGCLP